MIDRLRVRATQRKESAEQTEGKLDKLGQRLDKLEGRIDNLTEALKTLLKNPDFQRDIQKGLEVLKLEDPAEYSRVLKVLTSVDFE